MKQTIWIVSGVLLVAALVLTGAKESNTGYDIGSYVKDFNLPNIDGKMVSLKNYESNAKGAVVVFTCNTCPYAKAYEQRIIDLDKKYASMGFPVIAINPNDIVQQPDDSMEAMQQRAAEKGYTFPYLRDDSQDVTRAFGASKTPHFYLLSKEAQGKWRVEYIGALDDSPRESGDVKEKYVEDAINALLAGKKPAITSKRAIGCTIKWTNS